MRSVNIKNILWIDAICINQNDIEEKNRQVGIMREIYKEASKVHVWLGDVECSHLSGFQFLKRVASGLDASGAKKVTRSLYREIAEVLVLELIQVRDCEKVAELLELSYWTRIWIVQEFFLAKDIIIHCGKLHRDENDFYRSFTHLSQKFHSWKSKTNDEVEITPSASVIASSFKRIEDSPGMRIMKGRRVYSECSIIELLKICRRSGSTDPHDKVYAILGLRNDNSREHIPIDYNRDIFKMKMDVAWYLHTRPGAKAKDVAKDCGFLDGLFEDCEDEEDDRFVLVNSQRYENGITPYLMQ